MSRHPWLLSLIILLSPAWLAAAALPSIQEKTAGMERQAGYFSFYWEASTGHLHLEIPRAGERFLYLEGLRTGLGSNPVGLDRGQLGPARLVRFERSGPRLLLIQENLRFRALTENADERRAVRESFAQSVLWAGTIEAESGERLLVDATSWLLGDVHRVAARLKASGQGTFRLDPDRSAVDRQGCKGFPRNTELEARLTFASSNPGPLVRQTAPTPQAVTLRQHLSLVRLPDPGYRPRRLDPRAGTISTLFFDYAVPLDQPLEKRYILRHRLEKKDPAAAHSQVVHPIVYYVDRGAPEPVRSALIEGASWWSAAFEAAGFEGAFRVEVMPEGADPLDVRYNVIQWVHRSTRGWSYGGSVVDPRTGEILKGHVTLGSLRVRQDRMIIEGLTERAGGAAAAALAAFDPATDPVQVALARIRQLAAHEVGHTLGLAHNFAASTYGRASVMDYPAPLVRVRPNGTLDLSQAYARGIGAWDRFAVAYAYSQFPPGTDETKALGALVRQGLGKGLVFLTDADARPPGAAQPRAGLWDNGADPVDGLKEVMRVRRAALRAFGERNIREGAPYSDLQELLVPLYLFHRYQLEAAAKMVGGAYYRFALRGDGQTPLRRVPPNDQRRALQALLETLDPKELTIPEATLRLLAPLPYGSRPHERFAGRMDPLFDPLAAVETAADLSLSFLLQPQRASRLNVQHRIDERYPSLEEVIDTLVARLWKDPAPVSSWEAATRRVIERRLDRRLMALAGDGRADPEVRAIARAKLKELAGWLGQRREGEAFIERAQREEERDGIRRFLARSGPPLKRPPALQAPPGSPIGH